MFESCLYFNTASLARQLEREWAYAFKPFKLTPPQAFMLRVILDQEAITSTALSLALNISKATCSRSIDGLIALGYVSKVQADTDARSYELKATDEAIAIRDALNKASGEVTRRIKRVIGNTTFDDTVEHLKIITKALQ